uniref:Uncharacterized protein n=1 Tax=Anopheles merus TaxID=30066 RepID=A0A182URF7_ANOME
MDQLEGRHQRHVPVVLGFLLLVLPFLPATNLVVTVGFVVAERVLYIPSMGCLILVVYGAQRLWERLDARLRRPFLLLTIVLLAAGCLKTIARNQDWSSREALLRSGLKTLPHNAKMHYNFGNFLRDSSRPEPAIAHYREALRLWPTYASAHNNIGTLMPQFATAEYHFREAIKYASEHINAHYNLGQLYRKSNRTSDAIRMLERCIQLEPLFTAAYLELVKLYGGQPAAAGRLLARVVRLNPYNADLRRQYGDWLMEQIRLSNGGIPIQNDIYLRDWSIKHELRNRAMIYDSGSSSSGSSGGSGSTSSSSSSSSTNTGTGSTIVNGDSGPTTREDTGSIKDCSKINCRKQTDPRPPAEPAEISIRILRTPHCNRSEHIPSSLKACKLAAASAPPTTAHSAAPEPPSTHNGKGSGKTKKWSKSRHKPKRQQPSGTTALDPNGAPLAAPLLVSNLLDKL